MLNLDENLAEASKGCSLSSNTTSSFIRNLYVLQDSRKILGGQVESWQGLCCWILMKLSQKLLKYDLYPMTKPPGSSGTSTSSKTPGGDLEDRWSLDRVSAFSKFFRNLLILKDSRERLWGQVESWRVSDVGYWWNFHRNFLRIIPIIWHQLLVHQESLQVHQEPPFSPRLQEETWRTMEFWWVSGVGSWWNLTWSHLLVHIQHACPIKDSTDSRWLQKDTWRKGGV